MLTRLIVPVLFALLLGASALAQDAERLAGLAASLTAEANLRFDTAAATPAAPAPALEAFDPFITDVQDFVVQAAALSSHIDAVGGAMDLRCIFRGMSGDADSRLEALQTEQTGAERARVYREYAELFLVASQIARDEETTRISAMPCPVDPAG